VFLHKKLLGIIVSDKQPSLSDITPQANTAAPLPLIVTTFNEDGSIYKERTVILGEQYKPSWLIRIIVWATMNGKSVKFAHK
jgi:hypothetical protein